MFHNFRVLIFHVFHNSAVPPFCFIIPSFRQIESPIIIHSALIKLDPPIECTLITVLFFATNNLCRNLLKSQVKVSCKLMVTSEQKVQEGNGDLSNNILGSEHVNQ